MDQQIKFSTGLQELWLVKREAERLGISINMALRLMKAAAKACAKKRGK